MRIKFAALSGIRFPDWKIPPPTKLVGDGSLSERFSLATAPNPNTRRIQMDKNAIAGMKQGLVATRDWDSFQAILRKTHGVLARLRKVAMSDKDKKQ